MGGPPRSNVEMSDKEEGKPRRPRLWRPVDPSIWTPGPARGRLQRAIRRVLGVFTGLPSSIMAVAVITPLFFLLSILGIYSVAGPTLFGPALLTVAFVLVLEKTGYARNFEGWDFPLTPRRIVAVPAAFLIIVGILYLLVLILRHAPA